MDSIQEIKNRLSIVDVVSSYIQLKPAGRNFKALCPFHNDHTPSLVVSPERDMAWCFACNNGGDIFGFVEKIENISFQEALKLLAERAGVALPNYSPEKKEKKDRIIEVLEVATKKFEHNYSINIKVKEEVAKRKISEETLKKFRVGFAWKGDTELEKYLIEKGFSRREMLDAGLLIPLDNKGEKTQDKFRSRIIFPFFNSVNSVIGFSGRVFGDFEPKFLNSPETILFKKSEILYGLNFAREHIKKHDFTLVVEGQYDCLACVDHGIENVVAASGTAFSESHTKQMLKYSKNIVFALDADNAGIAATKRAIEIAVSQGANVYIVELPEGKDPDDLLREDEKEFFLRLEKRIGVMDFFFEHAFKGKDAKKLEDKKLIINEIFPIIKKYPKKYEQDSFLQNISSRLSIDIKALRIDFNSFNETKSSNLMHDDDLAVLQKRNSFNQREFLIGMLMAFPEYIEIVENQLIENIFPECQEKILLGIIKEKIKENNDDVQKNIKQIAQELPQQEQDRINLIALFAEEKTEKIPETLREKEFKKLITQLNRLNFKETQKKLINQMKDLKKGSQDERDLLIKLNQLAVLSKNF